MPFDGFTQEDFAQKMIDAFKAAGVPPKNVFSQSFEKKDILYWIKKEPEFGRQAVFLDNAQTPKELPDAAELMKDKAAGINIVAPPIFALLALDSAGNIVPSVYAKNVKTAGLHIITWTLERSGILADGDNGFYYQTIDAAIKREGDMMKVLDVLGRDVGILGVFSDWAAPVTFYANCMGLGLNR
jgi:glycerophosphoryl diester phosphodiesterase